MADESGTRPYHSPLRERQAADTRRDILRAAAEIIAGDGLTDFSMRSVAARAKVSERTVYHHFPSRQVLLDGLAEWVDDQLRELRLQADPRDIEDMPGRIAALFSAFEDIGAPALAMARLAAVHGIRSAAHEERTAAFRDRFADLLDPLPPDEAERCFAVVRHLVSSTTWLTLRDEFRLGGEDAARAIAWALDALLEELRRRSG